MDCTVDGHGDMAIELPEFSEVHLKKIISAHYFLSLPDVMNEYKRWLFLQSKC